MPTILKVAPILFVLLWSSAFVGAKYGMPYSEPLTFMCLRFSSVTAIFLLLSLIFKAPWPNRWREVGNIAFVGLLVQALYLSGTFIALDRGTSVGFVALELAGGISLDAQRVHDADLVPAPVQLECEVFAITAGGLQAGVYLTGLMPFEPLVQPLEASRVVCELG